MGVATVEVDTVMVVGMATVGTADMDIEDMAAVIMLTVLIFAHIPIGMGILIGEAAGCQDIGDMVIGFPVIMCLAIKK